MTQRRKYVRRFVCMNLRCIVSIPVDSIVPDLIRSDQKPTNINRPGDQPTNPVSLRSVPLCLVCLKHMGRAHSSSSLLFSFSFCLVFAFRVGPWCLKYQERRLSVLFWGWCRLHWTFFVIFLFSFFLSFSAPWFAVRYGRGMEGLWKVGLRHKGGVSHVCWRCMDGMATLHGKWLWWRNKTPVYLSVYVGFYFFYFFRIRVFSFVASDTVSDMPWRRKSSYLKLGNWYMWYILYSILGRRNPILCLPTNQLPNLNLLSPVFPGKSSMGTICTPFCTSDENRIGWMF